MKNPNEKCSAFPTKKPTLNDVFENAYLERVKEFANDVANVDTSGIPEPHLPHWGIEYENAPWKIGFIGIDTLGWGYFSDFSKAVKEDPRQSLYRGKEEFDDFEFVNWTNNFGTTFWDTSLKILAGLYGIDDWKSLKRLENTEPLKRFFWANANSVEQFKATPESKGASWDNWHKVKVSSEKHIDSFRRILDVFQPHVVFLLNWEPGGHFLDFPIAWNIYEDYQAEAVDPTTGCLILNTAHPGLLSRKHLFDEAINGVVQRAIEKLKTVK